MTKARRQVDEELRPGVHRVETSYGAASPAVLLGLGAAAEDDLEARPSHHDDGEDHEHDDFLSFSLDLPETESPQALLDRILPVVRAHDVLRIKGFAAVAGKDMRLVVQGVGPRLQHYYDRAWTADEVRGTRLVVIGTRDLDESAVRQALLG